MKVVVQRSTKGQVDGFFEWLKTRATDADHETNKDVIADFVDKVLVFEMKKLANADQAFDEEIEIPDQALLEPLLEAKKGFDEAFEKILKGNGITLPKTATSKPEFNEEMYLKEVKDLLDSNHYIKAIKHYRDKFGVGLQEAKEIVDAMRGAPTTTSTPRSGNGHKSEMTRKLNDQEKDVIRAEFMAANGVAEDDHWVAFKGNPSIGAEVAIFQITGFVSYLHREVACGRIDLPDMPAYLGWMKTKKALWAQYNSSKYEAYRRQVAQAKAAGQPLPPRPVFAQGFPRKR